MPRCPCVKVKHLDGPTSFSSKEKRKGDVSLLVTTGRNCRIPDHLQDMSPRHTLNRLFSPVEFPASQLVMGQQPVPLVNIPIPTKIGSNMGGSPATEWDPKTVLTSQPFDLRLPRCGISWVYYCCFVQLGASASHKLRAASLEGETRVCIGVRFRLVRLEIDGTGLDWYHFM